MKAAAVLGALVLATTVFFYPEPVHAASPIQTSRVRILSADGTVLSSFSLKNGNMAGGFSLSSTDVGNDGVPEIILGGGLGSAPEVIVARQDGSIINRFLAYAPNAGMGINVAACDLDGDGFTDIVTAAQRGGGPHVRIFSPSGLPKASFFAYDAEDRNGVNLACGDLNGDGKAEFITLPAAGAEPLARVWTWDGTGVVKTQEFLALEPGDLRGVVGTVRGNQLIVSSQHASKVSVRTFAFASPAKLVGDISSDVDVAGVNGVVMSNGEVMLASASHGTMMDAQGHSRITIANAPFGSVNAVSADLDGDGQEELIVADGKPGFMDDASPKAIVVDVSEQRLYAYEKGILINSFLISTAARGYVTPPGKHVILAKVPLVHYAGPGYDLGIIPYNLRFLPHFYIHYAPWNNNFGNPMSHGCVNVNLENVKWIYNWTDVGIPMEVRA